MLRIGYVVLAHNNPAQLLRLLKALEGENIHIFLHIDKRVDLAVFTNYPGITEIKNLMFLPRFKSYWGGVGLVHATLEGVHASLEFNCDYTILLSGADYPLHSNTEISNFLLNNKGKSYITHYKMPAPHWLPGKEITRIKKYYFRFNNTLFEYPIHPEMKGVLRRTLNFILSFFLKKERAFPKNIIPYGGDQWFCLDNYACKQIELFHKQNPVLMKFLNNSLIADEIFFQTALFNSKDEKLVNNIVNDTITYLNWKNKNEPSPAILTLTDYDKLMSSGKLFARKFDLEKHPGLIDKIDAQRFAR